MARPLSSERRKIRAMTRALAAKATTIPVMTMAWGTGSKRKPKILPKAKSRPKKIKKSKKTARPTKSTKPTKRGKSGKRRKPAKRGKGVAITQDRA